MSKADDNEARQVREREMRHMRDTREMRSVVKKLDLGSILNWSTSG